MTTPSDAERILISRFFAAMQTGATAEPDMMRLFAEDAEYIEPFSGQQRTHRGKASIRAAMQESWKTPLPDIRIVVDDLSLCGDTLEARWTCYSPALPGGHGRGLNLFQFRDGRIARLETRIVSVGSSSRMAPEEGE